MEADLAKLSEVCLTIVYLKNKETEKELKTFSDKHNHQLTRSGKTSLNSVRCEQLEEKRELVQKREMKQIEILFFSLKRMNILDTY